MSGAADTVASHSKIFIKLISAKHINTSNTSLTRFNWFTHLVYKLK